MIIVNQSVLRRCNPSISLGTSTETLRFTRRVRVSEIIKPWRVSDILHSLPKGFSDSYCEICHQIILCFLRWGSKFGHFKWPSDAYLRLAGAHGKSFEELICTCHCLLTDICYSQIFFTRCFTFYCRGSPVGGGGGGCSCSFVPNKIFLEFPCSLKVFFFSICLFLTISETQLFFPCSQLYFLFGPLFPIILWPCSLDLWNPWRNLAVHFLFWKRTELISPSLRSKRLRNKGRAVLGNAEGARSTREARAARVSLFLHRAP